MAVHVIQKGLDLPIKGAPEQRFGDTPMVGKVAILARDYPFMKPRMHVQAGDRVKRGQLLFEDRKTEGVRFTSPGAGTVAAINRGARRALQSVVIELTPSERRGKPEDSDLLPFDSFTGCDVAKLDSQTVLDLLVESGLWTAIRQRPFSKVPSPSSTCHSIFVTAIDTNPLSPDPEAVLEGQIDDLQRGLKVLGHLTKGNVYLCRAPGAKIEPGDAPRVQVEEFAGKHPAGLAGTHIHLLDPVHREKAVWYIGYQDVAAIGRLFESGRLPVGRTVALGGPVVIRPRLLKTRLGAHIDPLIDEELFRVLYHEETGRPNKSVKTVVGTLILKEMFDLTDNDALWRLEFDLGWQVALEGSPHGPGVSTILWPPQWSHQFLHRGQYLLSGS